MSSPPEYVPLLIATMYGADPTPKATSQPPVVNRHAYSVITQATRANFGWVVTRLVSHVSAFKNKSLFACEWRVMGCLRSAVVCDCLLYSFVADFGWVVTRLVSHVSAFKNKSLFASEWRVMGCLRSAVVCAIFLSSSAPGPARCTACVFFFC